MRFLILLVLATAWGAMALAMVPSRRRARAQQIETFADRLGLQFGRVDLLGLIDHNLDVFCLDDGARVRNVVWGRWQGVPVASGDLSFCGSRSGGTRGIPPLSVAVVEISAFLPHLTIRHRPPLVGQPGSRRFDDFRFESEPFNRRFHVEGRDREFAWKLVDARMMQQLLDTDERFEFEIFGTKLLAYGARVDASGLEPLLQSAVGVRSAVPRMVLREYAVLPQPGARAAAIA